MADKFQLKALITGVDKLSPTLTGIRKNVANFRKQLNSSGLGNIGFKDVLQGGAFAAPFVAGAKAAIDFESAMADVKKVVNFDTPEQFQQMNKDVLDLSEQLPMAANGIAAIVAAGGQAGLPREELKAFATDAVKMGIAFDQTAEQSGDMMAKWRTSFKLTQPEVVALADKINYLSNNGPASAQQISDIVTRIGPLGAVAGLASGQIAAMGATLAGVGVPGEVAATGMKNFMLALTKGGAATKQQSQAFKSLRLDVKQLASDMQKDAQGTIEKVLTAISKVDPAKQAAVLTNLFGTESVGAIAPMLTNLDLLKKNFASVGKDAKYAGSMEQEYASRSATTANAIQLLQNRVAKLGITVGAILLPPINDALEVIGPWLSQLSGLVAEHPEVIKGVLGAAVAFGLLRLAVMGAVVATKVLSAVTSMSPVGLIVRGIALAAGVLIGNWSTVAPYFQALWEKIRGPARVLWEWIKTAFAWTPLGMIINNWQPLVQFFGSLWGKIKSLSAPFFSFLKAAFAWTPLGMIITNWQPLGQFFSALWGDIKSLSAPFFSFLRAALAWTPLGMIINNWQPLGQFFGSLWGVIKALSVPFFDFLKAAFAWTPLGMIINNWQPLGQFFGSLWDVIKGLSIPFLGFLKTAFDWSPMGMIVKNWEPISAWFQNLWGKLKPILEPMMKLFGGGSGETVLQAATGKANQFAEQQRQRNAGVGGGTGAFLAANATETTRLNQQRMNDATGIPSTSQLLSRPALPAPGSLLQAGAAGGKAQLQGEMVMRFEGAPPGMRVEPAKTNQPGLTVTPSVGYRTIGNGGKP